ncbi:CpaD family pilus assembly protein [Nitratireductor sp. XY-223]|uniref:CpaD family pilus assembly protein n=1 Tax=Nitratireductor sp. XY-223 TaxID=2561926 RepID=UPI001FEF4AB8|nr:CpaD family pilus assembly protein [Nitratireductor sp. XY-223]
MTHMDTVSMKRLAHHPRGHGSLISVKAAMVMAAALLAGCANVHDIEVGAVPDDYRTNHPIMIAEKAHTIDVPIARGERKLNYGRVASVRGFASEYREMASGSVQIMTPVGSPNAGAASRIAKQVRGILVEEGIPARRIAYTSYQAAAQNDAAPIRLSFVAISAHTNQCGKWPEDLVTNTMENKHYDNFGCATQNNLAAQIANPSDLIAPRGMTPIDAQRRDVVIENYRKNGSYATPSE